MKTLNEQQRKALREAVAEIAGWKPVLRCPNCREEFEEDQCIKTDDGTLYCPHFICSSIEVVTPDLPDYLGSLDAVNEVETAMEPKAHADFRQAMKFVVMKLFLLDDAAWKADHPTERGYLSACALHRCIAIVMAVRPEKWQEIEAMGGMDETA